MTKYLTFTTALITVALAIVISPTILSARVDYSGFDDAATVSDSETNRDAPEVITFCYDALFDGFDILTKNDCDTSMVFFSNYCASLPDFLPAYHYCTSQNLRDTMDVYLEERDLWDVDDPGYYIAVTR